MSSAGGVVFLPTWTYSHGLHSVFQNVIYQDRDGAIIQLNSGRPSSRSTIIVSADRNPRRGAFALIGWKQGAQSSNPSPEYRLFWIDTSNRIFETCFSTTNDQNAHWYDGSLSGEFKAGPDSSIAANITRVESPGSAPSLHTRVYFQEESGHIRELWKKNADTAGPFELQVLDTRRPPGLKGTTIATDPELAAGSSVGTPEIYYQTPELKWYIDGAGAQPGFRPQDYHKYPPGAAIAVAGRVSTGNASVFTINAENTLVITQYNKNDPENWNPPTEESIEVAPNMRIWAHGHPRPVNVRPPHTKTIAVSKDQNQPWHITLIGYTGDPHALDILPPH